MPLSTVSSKRHRSLQLESLEDRKLLSNATAPLHGTATIHAHATGTFSNVPAAIGNPSVFATTINGQGTAQGYGSVTAVAYDTTTVTTRGRNKTAVLSGGTGILTDSSGKNDIVFNFTAQGPFTSGTRFRLSGVGNIVGGTGLLAGTRGRITIQGTADFSAGTISLDVVARTKY